MTRIVIVGGAGGTNVGESLRRAALALGDSVKLLDQAGAYKGPIGFRQAVWRVARRPWGLREFSRHIADEISRLGSRVLIATGPAPVTRETLDHLRVTGVVCLNFSTDDPWNNAHRSKWHLNALPAYDIVFTPRRANFRDLLSLGCKDVRYLPFGYDDELFQCLGGGDTAEEALFVGGADDDRAQFFLDFISFGCPLGLAGSYWERYRGLSGFSRGQLGPEQLLKATTRAAINLCLVRRANRDGHVMRSFEIPAVGGFMMAEDTEDHRAFFGSEGDYVLYFASAAEAAQKVKWALANAAERSRMAAACHHLVVNGANTYRDRIVAMLASIAT